MKKIAVLTCAILLAISSFAGGYQVNLQGHRALGMGHCATGLFHGPSSMFFNPGAFSMLDSSHFQINSHFVFANTAYQESFPGTYTTETQPGVGTPFSVYFNFKPKNSKFNFGVGVYTPFGATIGYDESWMGNAVIQKMSLQTIFIQPTIAYQVNEKLGIGIGYIYGFGSFELKKAVPVLDLSGDYGQGVLSGGGAGHSFNVGVYFQASEALSIGASYRHKVLVSEDEGSAIFNVPSSLEEYFPSTTFKASLPMPGTFSAGAAYQVNDKLKIAIDYSFVNWSVYDTLSFDFKDNTDKLEDIASARMYKNTNIFRVGGEYQINDMIIVRAGAYYDMTPVQDDFITPETPGSNKLGVTCGASMNFKNGLAIDASFLYIEGAERTATNIETNFGGTWKSKALILGIGVTYAF
jgi:long-chain fatty acid transport protein